MCTAVSFRRGDHYFGRNLDVEESYGEGVVITPRNFAFRFRHMGPVNRHYAMIGMAKVVEDYPLYFDGTNEKGLSIAGLNFPHNAKYHAYRDGKTNIASFEVIPYILGRCGSVDEVKTLLADGNITQDSFCKDLPPAPLHWLISDNEYSIVLESTAEGTKIYEDPYGVLTNNPPFPYHLENIHQYMGLHEGLEENRLSTDLPLKNISLGFGAVGLPGDFSSISRFVKAVFVKEKVKSNGSEKENVQHFFHILSSVAMPKGCVRMEHGAYEYTRYSSCCNTHTGVYYFNTYYDLSVRKIPLHGVDLEESNLFEYPIE